MTRSEAIAQITQAAEDLDDDALESLVAYSCYLSGPTVFSTLTPAERAQVDAALDELDRAEGLSWEAVKQQLDAKLKAAGA